MTASFGPIPPGSRFCDMHGWIGTIANSSSGGVFGPMLKYAGYDLMIMNECCRAAGRTGVGAVMGSKNLKGVAVRGPGRSAWRAKAFREAMLKAVRLRAADVKQLLSKAEEKLLDMRSCSS